MCQQPGAAFTESAAWLNTYPLLSYSVKFGSRCQRSLGFAPDVKLCDMWRGKGRDKRNMEKNAAEIRAPLFSHLSTGLSLCIRLCIHHTFPTPHSLFVRNCACEETRSDPNKIFSFFKEKSVAKHCGSRLSNGTETICTVKNNYLEAQFNKQSRLGCISVRLRRRQRQILSEIKAVMWD